VIWSVPLRTKKNMKENEDDDGRKTKKEYKVGRTR
jgi:hypothetical protein